MIPSILLCSVLLANINGFLIDNNPPNNQTRTNLMQYLTIGDRNKIHRDIERQHQDLEALRTEQTQALNILAAQLKQRLDEMDGKLVNSSNHCGKCETILHENTDLYNRVTSLENYIIKLELELANNKNRTNELENELGQLKSWNNITNFQALSSLASKLETLETTIHSLESREQTRHDEFQAFENSTEYSIKEIHRLEEALNYSLSSTQTSVAVTALSGVSRQCTNNDVIKFPVLRTSVGLVNRTDFRHSGKFTCVYPGLYLISPRLMTDTKEAIFLFYKNDRFMNDLHAHSNALQGNREVVAVYVLELQTGDTVYVTCANEQYVYSSSVMTIVKIN